MTASLIPAPAEPLTLDEVVERWPKIRQSWLASFDDCPLSSWFGLRYQTGMWATIHQAIGIMFHRVAAACLEEMRQMDSETIPVGVALAILEEKLAQRDVPAEERVRIPIREIPTLRWLVAKFARDNSFTVRHLVDVEKQLEAKLSYTDADGVVRERILTGRPDALVADPNDPEGAIIPDFKSGWGLPAERKGDKDDAVSYEGLFQLHFYGWLVMMNFPSVERVKLREFYARRTKARKATFERKDLKKTEEMLAETVRDLDLCLASGKPRRLRFPDVAPWNPSPGKHCSNCVAPHLCPIEPTVRSRYAITTKKEATKAVAILHVAEAIRDQLRQGLRPYFEGHGPVPVKWSRGRLVYGLKTQKGGRPVMTSFVPEGADRAPQRQQEDRALEDALREAAEKAKENGS